MIYKAPNHCSGWILSSLFYKWGHLSLVEVKYFPKGTQWACGRPRIWNSYLSDSKSHSFSPISRTLYLVEFPQDIIPRVVLSNQSVTISVGLVTYPSVKIPVTKRQEKLCANLLSTFPKDLMLFQIRGEHCQAPFFFNIWENYMQGNLVITSYFMQQIS